MHAMASDHTISVMIVDDHPLIRVGMATVVNQQPDMRIAAEAEKGWGRFASVVSPVPVSLVRMQEEDRLRVGAREWRVVVGCGHSPEHACLVDEEGGLMIAGDQVLPRITSNVSLSLSEPESDPPEASAATARVPSAASEASSVALAER